ncbi:MAG TPA: hypothetical protein VLE95_04650 [Chlamydiales bacterium]|nr:hypothetical protein [Chlamydiales bacterium]
MLCLKEILELAIKVRTIDFCPIYRNNLKNREFDKEAAQFFASGASDHCRMARRERRQKKCCQVDVVKNRFFGLFRYTPNNRLLKFIKVLILLKK